MMNATETALTNNFDLKSIKLKRDVDEAFVDLDRSDYWPSLAAFGNYSYSGSSDDFKFQNYSSAMVGLSFSINLFRGTQTKNKVQQSMIAVKQTDEKIKQLKDYVTVQVKAKILELERVKSVIEAQGRNVKLAERAYEISTIRYKEGTGNQLEIQNADIALRQAKTNILQSVYDYINAKSELELLLGSVKDEYITIAQQKVSR
jgi:outer membrane protein TolC